MNLNETGPVSGSQAVLPGANKTEAKAEEVKTNVTPLAKAPAKKAKAKTTVASVAPRVKIADLVLEGLFITTGKKDPDGRKIGLSFEQIVAHVKKKNPKANTTVNCVTWYKSKVVNGLILPPKGKTMKDMPIYPRKIVG